MQTTRACDAPSGTVVVKPTGVHEFVVVSSSNVRDSSGGGTSINEANSSLMPTSAFPSNGSLDGINARHEAEGLPPFKVGIGINTGEVVAGYIGSSQALEYTVIGDPVNTGSRLCALSKAGQVLVSEGTREKLGDHFELEELAKEKVKGKAQPIRVFEVTGRADRD